MNIFFLSLLACEAAQMQCDKHVVKMILESFQLLSTCFRLQLGDDLCADLYKKTHVNHPCSVWLRKSKMHVRWLIHHTYHLLQEYTFRYGKVHACQSKFETVCQLYELIPEGEPESLPPLCMPEQYKIEGDVANSYRAYYLGDKKRFAKWTRRHPPTWWVD